LSGAGTHGGGQRAGIDPEQCAEDLDGQRDLGIDRADMPPPRGRRRRAGPRPRRNERRSAGLNASA